MSLLLGSMLGIGLVLAAAPFLWPRAANSPGRARRLDLLDRARGVLAQAGFRSVPVSALMTISLLAAAAAALVSFAILSVVAIAVLAGVVALCLPSVAVGMRAAARRKAGRVLWPDAVDHLLSAVRSGLALPDAVATLARTGPLQTRDAFGRFELNYAGTGSFGTCLDLLKADLADPVADRILETLRMSREVGGSEITTVLRNLASFLRDEAAIRMEVEARQSWTINAARLGAGAPWVILVLLASRPEAAAAYSSTAGTALIVGGAAVSILAYRLMIALGRLPAERRWFG